MTTTEDAPSQDEDIAGVTTVTARRIGLLSDDHNADADGSDLPAEVLRAFDGVDLIVHLGHMGGRNNLARGVLDRLETVAPTLAIREYYTGKDGSSFVSPADAPRVAGLTRVIDVGGMRIGAVHNLNQPPGPAITAPPGGLAELQGIDLVSVLPAKFGCPVDMVAYAGTHRAAAISAQGVLFVNPGSPTYPKGPGRVDGERNLGTVGVLDIGDGVATFEIIELSLLAQDVAA